MWLEKHLNIDSFILFYNSSDEMTEFEEAVQNVNSRLKGGRKKSSAWTSFNDETNNTTTNATRCKHCRMDVNHYKKSTVAIQHMNRFGTLVITVLYHIF